jgi:hypothetical protein
MFLQVYPQSPDLEATNEIECYSTLKRKSYPTQQDIEES